jgi:membrane-bound ClpP family serine protease
VSQFAAHRRGAQVARGVHGGLTGQPALTLDVVGESHLVGHVRLAGERWLAVSGDDSPIPAGTTVVVVGVQGTTLVVYPMGDDTGPGELGPAEHNKAPDGADGSTS